MGAVHEKKYCILRPEEVNGYGTITLSLIWHIKNQLHVHIHISCWGCVKKLLEFGLSDLTSANQYSAYTCRRTALKAAMQVVGGWSSICSYMPPGCARYTPVSHFFSFLSIFTLCLLCTYISYALLRDVCKSRCLAWLDTYLAIRPSVCRLNVR